MEFKEIILDDDWALSLGNLRGYPEIGGYTLKHLSCPKTSTYYNDTEGSAWTFRRIRHDSRLGCSGCNIGDVPEEVYYKIRFLINA